MTFKCMYTGVKHQKEPLTALQEMPMASDNHDDTVQEGKFLENSRMEKAIGDVLAATEATSKSPEVRVSGKLLAASSFVNKEDSLLAGKIEPTNEPGEEFSDAKLDVASVQNPNGTD
ncbi:hypothetical protein RDI58_015263 [Solanum bulbocastanum]|uniref:Uncharacterized protein n=1 Tax=Solanum bulbocastanum TaxID=147425 RepID=A0AAN8TE09_SOLBU